MLTEQFIADFKARTEASWRLHELDPEIHGFQIQRGTRWNPGLSEDQIKRYEHDLGFAFPPALRLFLAHLNGTDIPTLNVYGHSGEPHRTRPGIYAWPRDLATVKESLRWVREDWKDYESVLASVGLGGKKADLFPFFHDNCIVCGPDFPEMPVITIDQHYAVLYDGGFGDYLERRFLNDRDR